MSAGHLGLAATHFQVSVEHFFLGKPDAHCNLCHMLYLFKMLTEKDIIDYIHTLTTMQVIEKGFRLNYIKALF